MYRGRKTGEMTVDTMKALELAIAALKEKNITGEYDVAIRLLNRLQKRELAANWSQSKIISALDKWEKEYGYPPTVTNLIEPGMPGASIIQKYFGMRASAFLRQKYPTEVKNRVSKNTYGFTSEDDWLDCFRSQFLKHCSEEEFSSRTYNTLKDPDTPLWSTIARHCGVSQWRKLMELADVQYPNRIPSHTGEYEVTYSLPVLDRVESAVKDYRSASAELADLINRNRNNEMEFLWALENKK